MTNNQINKLRKLHAAHKAVSNRYYECLKSNASAAERHAVESLCTAAWEAKVNFTKSL